MNKITTSIVPDEGKSEDSVNPIHGMYPHENERIRLLTTIAILLLLAFTPLPVNAFRIMAPRTIYTHIALKKLVSTYRDAYEKIGMKDMDTHTEAREIFSDKEKHLIEVIQFSYPKNKINNKNGSTSFSIDAYTKSGICIECAVTRQTFSSEDYKADWRATKEIRKSLGKSGTPMCPTACSASVEEWINDRSGKKSIPNIDP